MIPWAWILVAALGVSTAVLAITAWCLSRDLDDAYDDIAELVDTAGVVDRVIVDQADRIVELTRTVAELEGVVAEQEHIIDMYRRAKVVPE